MEKNKDYLVAIYDNFQAINLSVEGKIPNANILYIIKCKFEKESYTGLNQYYSNWVFNSENEKVENNIIEYKGIICELEINEQWAVVISNHASIVIRVKIKDRLGIERVENINNRLHDGMAFQLLFDYIKLLDKVDTHKAALVVLQKNKTINKQDEKIVDLKNNVQKK